MLVNFVILSDQRRIWAIQKSSGFTWNRAASRPVKPSACSSKPSSREVVDRLPAESIREGVAQMLIEKVEAGR